MADAVTTKQHVLQKHLLLGTLFPEVGTLVRVPGSQRRKERFFEFISVLEPAPFQRRAPELLPPRSVNHRVRVGPRRILWKQLDLRPCCQCQLRLLAGVDREVIFNDQPSV